MSYIEDIKMIVSCCSGTRLQYAAGEVVDVILVSVLLTSVGHAPLTCLTRRVLK